MSYSRGGGVTATGGVAAEPRRMRAKKAAGEIPYLKIMGLIIAVILLGLAWLVISGYHLE
jgi:hypothetical protein